ncbi:MAG: Gfo/Idh/MocA family oxidoreductase [Planctomycetes bacterium]|nr:Gfo/Idh/MocA family oxidoreductase [Planctomycetota bacterium]
MAEGHPVRLAVVGCGNISGPYGDCISKRPEQLKILGAFDEIPEKASAFCQKFGGRVYPSMDALLADSEVETVVNLTIHTAHAAVTRRALEAGKNVHSEKPLATDRGSGREVVELARRKGLMLTCSPFVILGESQQTLWKAVRDGLVGEVVSVNAEMFWGRVESWHPHPGPFYAPGAGPMLDVGCYPLNVLTSILGPVRQARGLARVTIPDREILSGPQAGQKFQVTTPDIVFGLLEFENGSIGRLSATFSPWFSNQRGLEIHGTRGSLAVENVVGFDTPVKLATYPKREWEALPFAREPYKGVDWSRGVCEAALALRAGRPPRVSGAQALHILDVCLSILESSERGRPVAVESRFDPPEPL